MCATATAKRRRKQARLVNGRKINARMRKMQLALKRRMK